MFGLSLLALTFAPRSDEGQIRAAYEVIRHGMLAKDIKAIDSTGAPGLQSKHGALSMNAQQTDKQLVALFAMCRKITQLDLTVESIKIKGLTAVVTSHTVLKADVVFGAKSPKVHKMVSTGTSRDTWIKTPNGWKVRIVEDLMDSTSFDGKPSSH